MKVVFKIEMNEISFDKERSYYNHLTWNVKPNKLGITHIIEIYDDVSDYPMLKIYKGNFLFAFGDCDPIEEVDVVCGGRFVEVEIACPEHLFKETI